jgi:hypothetical protein
MFKLQQSCQIELLKEAWRTLVENLDILQTSFHFSVEVGRWAQVVHSHLDFKWTTEKRQSIDNAAGDSFGASTLMQRTAFNRPPVYLRHISSSSGEDYLIVVLHHALYDGISLPMLFKYIKAVCKGNPPSTSQFHMFSCWITSLEVHATDYWVTRLKGVHPWAFPQKLSSTADAWHTSKGGKHSKGDH